MDPQPRRPRRLTKSRFKLAVECPTKLAYVQNPLYGNLDQEDSFLQALAYGGFQVGALAKCAYPEGVEVETLDEALALEQTRELLQRPEVTIFEPAFLHGDLLIRVDILRKTADQIFLYEVKAKSYDPNEDSFFSRGKALKVLEKWKPYLYDVAFQAHVIALCHPEMRVLPYLTLVDKSAACEMNGLNQKFFVGRDERGRTRVETRGSVAPQEVRRVLVDVDVSGEVQHLHQLEHAGKSFGAWVEDLARSYRDQDPISSPVGSKCKNCEFRIGAQMKERGLRSGFDQCWKSAVGEDAGKPLVLDLWNGRPDGFLREGKFLLSHLSYTDLSPQPHPEKRGLSQSERQWLQVEKTVGASPEPYLDLDGLAAEMRGWKFPLHFIDFETSQVAIPFHRGRRPYETLAFQFSHHIVHRDGRVEHAGEFIHRKRGAFPNFEFIRALKAALESDSGTIFRYAPHENTVLCKIHDQLQASDLPRSEVEELCAWIRTVTKHGTEKEGDRYWNGERCMVDLRELVLRYYYHPLTGKSNSLKYVLPATLNASSFLQNKYASPIYGTEIPSRNFKQKQWIYRTAEGKVADPYRSLESILSPEEDLQAERLFAGSEIADGGAAMMAYARMQFTEMSAAEENRLVQALLRYCELDTLAMVFLYEYWRDELIKAGLVPAPTSEAVS